LFLEGNRWRKQPPNIKGNNRKVFSFFKKQTVTSDFLASHYAETIQNAQQHFLETPKESNYINELKEGELHQIVAELWSIQALTFELLLGLYTSRKIATRASSMLIVGYFPIDHKNHIINTHYYGPIINDAAYGNGSYPIKEISEAVFQKLSINNKDLDKYLQSFLKGNYCGLEDSIENINKRYKIVL